MDEAVSPEPCDDRSPWTARSEFTTRLALAQADPGLTDDLKALDASDDELGPIP